MDYELLVCNFLVQLTIQVGKIAVVTNAGSE
eukprot:SAG11_NODE_1588_length_4631_cov_7.220432_2_plen_31_part_00